jgi:hypothetical protein
MTARRVFVGLLGVFGLAILGADSSGAGAQSLPAAIYQGYGPNQPAFNSPPELTHAGTYAQTYNDLSDPFASYQFSVTLAGAPSPYVSAGVTSGSGTTYASGDLFYSFEIVGGAGATPVKLDVTASLFATSYGDGSGGAGMLIEQVSGVSFVYSSAGTACSIEAPCGIPGGGDWAVCSVNEAPGDCGSEPKSWAISAQESLYANTIYDVELSASTAAPDPLVKYIATGGGKGVADPHFAIDPSTPDPSAYSLAFSAGIGNSSVAPTTVPEPSTWILFGVGFAGAGLLRFSRRGLPKESVRGAV